MHRLAPSLELVLCESERSRNHFWCIAHSNHIKPGTARMRYFYHTVQCSCIKPPRPRVCVCCVVSSSTRLGSSHQRCMQYSQHDSQREREPIPSAWLISELPIFVIIIRCVCQIPPRHPIFQTTAHTKTIEPISVTCTAFTMVNTFTLRSLPLPSNSNASCHVAAYEHSSLEPLLCH